MNDTDIINFFKTKNGSINPNKTRISYLNKYPEYKEYLENRYEEFLGYKFTLQCIFNNLDTLPRCKKCNKLLNHIGKYCNSYCQLSDSNFKNVVNSKIDYTARTKKFKKTCNERYGVDVPAQNSDIMAKMLANRDFKKEATNRKQNLVNKLNVENVFQLPEVIEKIKQTKLTNRPNDLNNSKKIQETCELKYGAKSVLSIPEFIEKGHQTKLVKYGNSNYNNSIKRKQTCKELYGTEVVNAYGSDKFKQNMKNKYGVEYYSQSEEFNKNRIRKYYYDNIYFDSKPEVAFYIYHIDNNSSIEHEPCQFTYNYNGVIRFYTPDFKVNDNLYEIKGKYFFENNKMINPYNRDLDDLYQAKYKCMIENNIIIVNDYQFYIDYVESTYGKNYLNNFRVSKS